MPANAPIRVTHVVPSLEIGGAETVLTRLLRGSDRGHFPATVIALMPGGKYERVVEELGVPVHNLSVRRRGMPSPFAVPTLARLLRTLQPDVVHCWMYHANLMGGLAAKLAARTPAIWAIRQTNIDRRSISVRTRAIVRLSALLSHWLPSAVIYNAQSARRVHRAAGFDDRRADVLANGFDTQLFRPNPDARSMLRAELAISDETPLVGLVARFDPQKDHRTFAAAAGLVLARRPHVRFVLCGRGVDSSNRQLCSWLAAAGATSACRLLGERGDVERIVPALDVACLSSMGEGFPNAIGEAMACGVPCAATDVGEIRLLIGDTGRVAPPSSAPALAEAIVALVDLEEPARRALGSRARARIQEQFSIGAMVAQYEALWHRTAAMRHALSSSSSEP